MLERFFKEVQMFLHQLTIFILETSAEVTVITFALQDFLKVLRHAYGENWSNIADLETILFGNCEPIINIYPDTATSYFVLVLFILIFFMSHNIRRQ